MFCIPFIVVKHESPPPVDTFDTSRETHFTNVSYISVYFVCIVRFGKGPGCNCGARRGFQQIYLPSLLPLEVLSFRRHGSTSVASI